MTWTGKGSEKGRDLLCTQKEDASHIIKMFRNKKWKEQLLSRKWLTVNEEVA
jgi:hypothetical protein